MNISADYGKAFMWYLKAAMQNNVHGQYYFAKMYEERKHIKQDLSPHFTGTEKQQIQDYAQAQAMVGMLYETGKGMVNAFLWYKKGAEQDDSNAICYIAMMFVYVTSVDLDLKTALIG